MKMSSKPVSVIPGLSAIIISGATMTGVGFLFCLTIIGAIIGIPMIMIGLFLIGFGIMLSIVLAVLAVIKKLKTNY